jgi:hypothetical protein
MSPTTQEHDVKTEAQTNSSPNFVNYSSKKIHEMSKVKALKSTSNIRQFWKKFKPPITIVYAAWDSNRWVEEFKKSVDRPVDKGKDVFSNLDSDKRYKLAEWLVSMGPLITTGDMFAFHYFSAVFTNMYGSNSIQLHEAWSLKRSLSTEKIKSVLSGNIVLVGGPSGNPITYELLKSTDSTSLFPDAPFSDFRIRKWGQSEKTDGIKAFILPHTIGDSTNGSRDQDCGLLLAGVNPWGEGETNFVAAMGSASWGTQACAALACSEVGTRELNSVEIDDKEDSSCSKWINTFGYVNVWPKPADFIEHSGRLPDLTTPESEFQMVYPKLGKMNSNPKSIMSTSEYLRMSNKGKNYLINLRFLVLFVSILSFCFATVAITTGIFYKQYLTGVSTGTLLVLFGFGALLRSIDIKTKS